MQVKALHKTNIMSAKFLPQTGDRQAVSCSGDGVVMVSGNIFNSIAFNQLLKNKNITISDLEKEDGSLQDVFRCHQGPVYEVVTVESEPNTFLSVGEDGTARWFDLRATKTCPTLRCKEV
jgi:nuclear receptor interaction protein